MAGVPAALFWEAVIVQAMAANFHRPYGIFIQRPPIFHSVPFSLRARSTPPISRPIDRLSFGAFHCMNKLPQITLAFWVMKICATTLGETAGDLLSMTLNVGYAISSMILISVFLVTLVTQLWSKTYNPVLYWIVILSTSTAGTTMSDFMDRTLGLGYATGSMILIVILMIIFALWHRSGRFPRGRFGAGFRRWRIVDRLNHRRGGGTQVLHPHLVGIVVLGGVCT